MSINNYRDYESKHHQTLERIANDGIVPLIYASIKDRVTIHDRQDMSIWGTNSSDELVQKLRALGVNVSNDSSGTRKYLDFSINTDIDDDKELLSQNDESFFKITRDLVTWDRFHNPESPLVGFTCD